jgi:4-cresol dehydrogenase (hydroxylating)
MNSLRWLAMSAPYPFDLASTGGALPADAVARLSAERRIPAWTGVGTLYGSEPVVTAARSVMQRLIEPYVERIDFVRPPIQDPKLAEILEIMAGRPNEAALPLAYWKSQVAQGGVTRDPGRDGCGVLWYAPLVPMKPECVRQVVGMVYRVCAKHGIEPLNTLTSLSERAFDSTVPLLFNRQDPDEAARAEACYHGLFAEGRKAGFLPYRMGVQTMGLVTDPTLPFWRFVASLKHAVDPDGIIAPGRYCPPGPTA